MEPRNNTSSAGLEDFSLLCVLGSGSYGKVYQVVKKVGEDKSNIYAMKVVKKSRISKPKDTEHAKTERAVLAAVKHPFIVKLYYAFQTMEKLYFVMDYAGGGELLQLLQRTPYFSEDNVRFYSAELVLALDYLHSYNIIFRDLKLENILLDCRGHVKLTDFGLSKKMASSYSRTYTFCGSLSYMAPEILKRTGYNKAVDWWSLGIVVYELTHRRSPFCGARAQLKDDIMKGNFNISRDISPKVQDFIAELLVDDPRKRLGGRSSDAEDVKRHPFYKGVNWQKVFNQTPQPHLDMVLQEVSEEDTSYFSSDFTRLPAVESVGDQAEVDIWFQDFDYVAPPF